MCGSERAPLPLTTTEIRFSVTGPQWGVSWMMNCFHWADEAFFPTRKQQPQKICTVNTREYFVSCFKFSSYMMCLTVWHLYLIPNHSHKLNSKYYPLGNEVTTALPAFNKTHFCWVFFCNQVKASSDQSVPGIFELQTERPLWKFFTLHHKLQEE